MLRVVLDANVCVSAALSSKGPPAGVLAALRDGQFDLVVSDAILDELGEVLLYPKIARRLGWSRHDVDAVLDALRRLGIVVAGDLALESVVPDDPDDARYVECAVEGDAEYLVTGDRHLLSLGQYEHVRIVTPRMFLEILAEVEPA